MGMCNVSVLRFKDVESKYGHLIPIEARYDIPYEVKRCFIYMEFQMEKQEDIMLIGGYTKH